MRLGQGGGGAGGGGARKRASMISVRMNRLSRSACGAVYFGLLIDDGELGHPHPFDQVEVSDQAGSSTKRRSARVGVPGESLEGCWSTEREGGRGERASRCAVALTNLQSDTTVVIDSAFLTSTLLDSAGRIAPAILFSASGSVVPSRNRRPTSGREERGWSFQANGTPDCRAPGSARTAHDGVCPSEQRDAMASFSPPRELGSKRFGTVRTARACVPHDEGEH